MTKRRELEILSPIDDSFIVILDIDDPTYAMHRKQKHQKPPAIDPARSAISR